MKKISLLFSLTALSLGLFAQSTTTTTTSSTATTSATTTTTATNPNAAEITFVEETHDFGKQQEGPKITYDFTFKNTGKEALVLTNVRASCGCTVPTWPKEPVMPGQTAVISVTYNTSGRPGPFTKSITVTSNAKTSTKIIYIKGEVIKVDETESMPLNSGSMLTPH